MVELRFNEGDTFNLSNWASGLDQQYILWYTELHVSVLRFFFSNSDLNWKREEIRSEVAINGIAIYHLQEKWIHWKIPLLHGK